MKIFLSKFISLLLITSMLAFQSLPVLIYAEHDYPGQLDQPEYSEGSYYSEAYYYSEVSYYGEASYYSEASYPDSSGDPAPVYFPPELPPEPEYPDSSGDPAPASEPTIYYPDSSSDPVPASFPVHQEQAATVQDSSPPPSSGHNQGHSSYPQSPAYVVAQAPENTGSFFGSVWRGVTSFPGNAVAKVDQWRQGVFGTGEDQLAEAEFKAQEEERKRQQEIASRGYESNLPSDPNETQVWLKEPQPIEGTGFSLEAVGESVVGVASSAVKIVADPLNICLFVPFGDQVCGGVLSATQSEEDYQKQMAELESRRQTISNVAIGVVTDTYNSTAGALWHYNTVTVPELDRQAGELGIPQWGFSASGPGAEQWIIDTLDKELARLPEELRNDPVKIQEIIDQNPQALKWNKVTVDNVLTYNQIKGQNPEGIQSYKEKTVAAINEVNDALFATTLEVGMSVVGLGAVDDVAKAGARSVVRQLDGAADDIAEGGVRNVGSQLDEAASARNALEEGSPVWGGADDLAVDCPATNVLGVSASISDALKPKKEVLAASIAPVCRVGTRSLGKEDIAGPGRGANDDAVIDPNTSGSVAIGDGVSIDYDSGGRGYEASQPAVNHASKVLDSIPIENESGMVVQRLNNLVARELPRTIHRGSTTFGVAKYNIDNGNRGIAYSTVGDIENFAVTSDGRVEFVNSGYKPGVRDTSNPGAIISSYGVEESSRGTGGYGIRSGYYEIGDNHIFFGQASDALVDNHVLDDAAFMKRAVNQANGDPQKLAEILTQEGKRRALEVQTNIAAKQAEVTQKLTQQLGRRPADTEVEQVLEREGYGNVVRTSSGLKVGKGLDDTSVAIMDISNPDASTGKTALIPPVLKRPDIIAGGSAGVTLGLVAGSWVLQQSSDSPPATATPVPPTTTPTVVPTQPVKTATARPTEIIVKGVPVVPTTTATAIPPTNTPVPPTSTSVPPTITATPTQTVTVTPVPPTVTPTVAVVSAFTYVDSQPYGDQRPAALGGVIPFDDRSANPPTTGNVGVGQPSSTTPLTSQRDKEAGAPQALSDDIVPTTPSDTLLNSSIRKDCDANLGYLVNIELWRIGGKEYTKPGALTNEGCLGEKVNPDKIPTRLNQYLYPVCDSNTGVEVWMEQWINPKSEIDKKVGAKTGKKCGPDNIPPSLQKGNLTYQPISQPTASYNSSATAKEQNFSLIELIGGFIFGKEVFAQEANEGVSATTQSGGALSVNKLMSQEDYAFVLAANQAKYNMTASGEVNISEVKEDISSNSQIQPIGIKTDNGIKVTTGSDGSVAFDVEEDVYEITNVSAVPGVDLTAPKQLIIENGVNMVYIAISEGSGGFKTTDNDDLVAHLHKGAAFSKVKIAAFYDENKNNKLDEDENPVPWAGITITLTKNTPFQTVNLEQGWNLITLPALPSKPLTAASLLVEIAKQGGYATTVSTLTDGAWNTYVKRGETDYSGEDFVIEPSRAYFVKVLKPVAFQFAGRFFESPQKTKLIPGWNAIGISKNDNINTASKLIDEINSKNGQADAVSAWEYNLWESFVKNEQEYGLDFGIFSSRGYLVRLKNEGEFEF